MTPRRLLGAMLVASVSGCALPMFGGRTAQSPPALHATTADTVPTAPPIVQVRDFRSSSVVSVLAWEADEARIGLRSEVSRKGTLVGGRVGDHILYLTPFYVWYMGGFAHAIAEPGKPLLGVGTLTDPYNCFYGSHCTPMTAIGVRLPDALLRSHRDSLVVTFLPSGRGPWAVTLRRELIAAFLTKVDSVVGEMR